MTSANNEPDGASEMLRRREERKAKRRDRTPRSVPPPRHPRPEATTNDATVKPESTGQDTAPAESEQKPAPATPPVTPPHDHDEPTHAAPEGAGEPTPEGEPAPAQSAPAEAQHPEGAQESGQAVSAPPAAAETAKRASDAALSWAAAARKQVGRLDTLAAAVRKARADGVPPLVLRAALADAEHRAGTPLPPEVWAAAEPLE